VNVSHDSASSQALKGEAQRAASAATTVLLTLAFRSEWDTRALVRAALAAGKGVAAPRVDAKARMLELHALTDPDRDVVTGHMGIPEPLPDTRRVPRDAIDFVLVPGLLPLLSPDAPRVAGALDLQIVERVPAAPHDVAVRMIVTELRTIAARQ